MNDRPPTPVNRAPLRLAVVWAVVTIPALWGVSKTVQTSLKLFQSPPPATQPASPTTTAPTIVPTTSPTTP